ncbi:MAG TPA: DUF1127 domain-containing protein [Alphaproteobacteria bacterium]|nr:DUF1127 domain-containing protein [Alphaproteobacteria bacterium]
MPANWIGTNFAPWRGGRSSRSWPVRPGRLLHLLLAWQERASQRHQLAELDERLLQDMGLNRLDVWQETRKPFWRR